MTDPRFKSQRRQRLSSTLRLRESWQFRRFFGESDVFHLGECTVFRVSNGLRHFRLGTTLKARGSSVERNRTKRVVREVFRTNGHLLGGYDYNVVIPASKKLSFPYPERLRESLARGISRIVNGDLVGKKATPRK